ncbi:MAG: carbohydrate-binding module family 20 domain-containing protein [bacterium]
MISSLAKRFWLLAALLIALACSTPQSSSFKTVTFRVIPKSLPPAAKIYITGNHSKLGNWQPNVATLHEKSDGSWSRSFSFHRGTLLEFKITRGNWETEAVNEMLDYPRIGEIFKEAASKPAAEAIDHLWKAGEAWANGNPLHDDTTLLVIKVKKNSRF